MPATKKPRQRDAYRIRYAFADGTTSDQSAVDGIVQAIQQWSAIAAANGEGAFEARKRLREVALDVIEVRGRRFKQSLAPNGRPRKDEDQEDVSVKTIKRRAKEERET